MTDIITSIFVLELFQRFTFIYVNEAFVRLKVHTFAYLKQKNIFDVIRIKLFIIYFSVISKEITEYLAGK